MNSDDIDQASNDDHLILGTITVVGQGWVKIEVDHCETVPQIGQRVKVLPEEQSANDKPTGDDHG
jgi:hypothetical protein